MHLTIAYFSNRNEPMIHWFFRCLKRDVNPEVDQIHVIFVDYHANREGRKAEIKAHLDREGPHLSSFTHVEQKPCIWQGPHKLTKKEYFAASNARNTAFALCRTDYIACVDDLSVLMPGWLDNVRHAELQRYLVMGAYKKVFNLHMKEANENYDITWTPHDPGIDSRFWAGSAGGIVPAEGSWLFGCSFGLPIEWALKVNGFDEICDGQGAEDYDFGIRLQRAGLKMHYNVNMLTLESEEMHSTPGNQHFIRLSKDMNFDGQRMGSDHVLLRRVTRENRTTTISNQYMLKDLRRSVLDGNPFPIIRNPQHDWRDGQPLHEM